MRVAFYLQVLALILALASFAVEGKTKLNKDTCEAVVVIAEAVALQYYIGTDDQQLIKWANTQKIGLRNIVIEVVKDAYGPSQYILRKPEAMGTGLFKNKWRQFCHQQLE